MACKVQSECAHTLPTCTRRQLEIQDRYEQVTRSMNHQVRPSFFDSQLHPPEWERAHHNRDEVARPLWVRSLEH